MSRKRFSQIGRNVRKLFGRIRSAQSFRTLVPCRETPLVRIPSAISVLNAICMIVNEMPVCSARSRADGSFSPPLNSADSMFRKIYSRAFCSLSDIVRLLEKQFPQENSLLPFSSEIV